mmetsp:Transcript_760/g.2831  ORF Transcript_760/g.2831 Transcript_760/m.2831 type:complete len:273 (-) Transcript_760:269-1087(-)
MPAGSLSPRHRPSPPPPPRGHAATPGSGSPAARRHAARSARRRPPPRSVPIATTRPRPASGSRCGSDRHAAPACPQTARASWASAPAAERLPLWMSRRRRPPRAAAPGLDGTASWRCSLSSAPRPGWRQKQRPPGLQASPTAVVQPLRAEERRWCRCCRYQCCCHRCRHRHRRRRRWTGLPWSPIQSWRSPSAGLHCSRFRRMTLPHPPRAERPPSAGGSAQTSARWPPWRRMPRAPCPHAAVPSAAARSCFALRGRRWSPCVAGPFGRLWI